MGKEENIITIPEGTEINHGLSEDSDSIILETPFNAVVAGEAANTVKLKTNNELGLLVVFDFPGQFGGKIN